jgi:hypothetical protein
MKYNYDELTIKEKFKEIKGVALENIKNGMNNHVRLTAREMRIVKQGEKLGLKLQVTYEGKLYNISYNQMTF